MLTRPVGRFSSKTLSEMGENFFRDRLLLSHKTRSRIPSGDALSRLKLTVTNDLFMDDRSKVSSYVHSHNSHLSIPLFARVTLENEDFSEESEVRTVTYDPENTQYIREVTCSVSRMFLRHPIGDFENSSSRNSVPGNSRICSTKRRSRSYSRKRRRSSESSLDRRKRPRSKSVSSSRSSDTSETLQKHVKAWSFSHIPTQWEVSRYSECYSSFRWSV